MIKLSSETIQSGKQIVEGIEVSLNCSFPIPIKVKDAQNKVVDKYKIVKTRNSKLMLQK